MYIWHSRVPSSGTPLSLRMPWYLSCGHRSLDAETLIPIEDLRLARRALSCEFFGTCCLNLKGEAEISSYFRNKREGTMKSWKSDSPQTLVCSWHQQAQGSKMTKQAGFATQACFDCEVPATQDRRSSLVTLPAKSPMLLTGRPDCRFASAQTSSRSRWPRRPSLDSDGWLHRDRACAEDFKQNEALPQTNAISNLVQLPNAVICARCSIHFSKGIETHMRIALLVIGLSLWW